MRRLALVPLLFVLAGCNLVHFGRLPSGPAVSDTEVARENTDLRTEKKILQQELTLARKESDALRSVLESGATQSGGSQKELVAKLNETTRELTALRASYAKLEADRSRLSSSGSGDAGAVNAKLGETQEKLAASLRSFTELQQENARLRAEVDRTHSFNSTLTAQVKDLTVKNNDAQAALAQLNTELLAQRDARARAESQAESARSQLKAVVLNRDRPATLADARASSASGATTFAAPALPEGSSAAAELRTSPARLREPPSVDAKPANASRGRIHIVKAGDTLASLAKQYYGDVDRWGPIYRANNDLLSGNRELKPGMELEIPER